MFRVRAFAHNPERPVADRILRDECIAHLPVGAPPASAPIEFTNRERTLDEVVVCQIPATRRVWVQGVEEVMHAADDAAYLPAALLLPVR